MPILTPLHSSYLLFLMCADEALKPYLPCLHTFLSISAPHLGYLYGSNNLFNSGLWMLKKLHSRAAAMHELTLTDAPQLEDCYLYKISQVRGRR